MCLVEMVFPSKAMATFPPANLSAMMPEPTTTASRNRVPSHSAKSLRAIVGVSCDHWIVPPFRALRIPGEFILPPVEMAAGIVVIEFAGLLYALDIRIDANNFITIRRRAGSGNTHLACVRHRFREIP